MNAGTSAIPFFDLRGQYNQTKSEIQQAVARVFETQQFILGPEVQALEAEIAPACGAKHAIGVSSGTDALLVALMALGVKAGDEVITTPFTFFATAGSIARLGAKPVFIDVDPATLNINPALIEARITPRTKAIMPVHIFGQCADMDAINEIAKRHKLPVIEDAAQAIGATFRGTRAGGLGEFGCFSFFPTKNLGACGEGGLVTANDDKLAGLVKLLRAHGAHSEYHHEMVGGNFRLQAFQGAVLRAKLKYLDSWNEQRRGHAQLYRELFAKEGLLSSSNSEAEPKKVLVPYEDPRCVHIYHQYVIRVIERDALAAHLKAQGIGTKVYYPVPLHQQPCFQDQIDSATRCPVSEQAAAQALALPIFPELTKEQIGRIAGAIASFYRA